MKKRKRGDFKEKLLKLAKLLHTSKNAEVHAGWHCVTHIANMF